MKCSTCKFGVLKKVITKKEFEGVVCRRYPQTHWKSPGEWCGEYKDKPGYFLGHKQVNLEGETHEE